jgi:hypothetical protein
VTTRRRRHDPGPWWLGRALAAGIVCAAVAGCGTSRIANGDALLAVGLSANSQNSFSTLRPGAEIGVFDVMVENRSSSSVTFTGVQIGGKGFGSVVRVVELRAAPVRGGRFAMPGGGYNVNPPAIGRTRADCVVQALFTLSGYRLAPRQTLRLWEVLEGVRPGSYSNNGLTITYSSSGDAYSEFIATGVSGKVSTSAKPLGVDPSQRPCVGLVKALPQ